MISVTMYLLLPLMDFSSVCCLHLKLFLFVLLGSQSIKEGIQKTAGISC